MPRGGRRAGAGAPDGNLNALKHGRRSLQLRQLFLAARRGAGHTITNVLSAATLARHGLVRRRRKARQNAKDTGGPASTNLP